MAVSKGVSLHSFVARENVSLDELFATQCTAAFERACFCEEMKLHMTVPAKNNQIFRIAIHPILVMMMYCNDLWNLVVSTLFATATPLRKYVAALCCWTCRVSSSSHLARMFIGARLGACKAPANFEFARANEIYDSANRTYALDFGDSICEPRTDYSRFCSARSAAKSSPFSLPRWKQGNRIAVFTFHLYSFYAGFVVRKKPSRSPSAIIPSCFCDQWLSASASTSIWRDIIKKFLMFVSPILRPPFRSAWFGAVQICASIPVWKGFTAYLARNLWLLDSFTAIEASKGAITVNPSIAMREYSITKQTGVSERGVSVTTSSFSASRPTFPIWQAVVWNVFGHAKDLLCGPFRKRLTVSWALVNVT